MCSFVVCIRVPLKAPLSFEFDLRVTVQTEVRTCFDMEALNVSHEVLLVIEEFLTHPTAPELRTTWIRLRDALLFDIRRDIVMLHKN